MHINVFHGQKLHAKNKDCTIAANINKLPIAYSANFCIVKDVVTKNIMQVKFVVLTPTKKYNNNS